MKPEIILALITIFSSLLTFFLAYNTGKTRRTQKSPAYEATKNKQVLIANRVHMNQIENMIVYLPILWMAGLFGPIILVAIVGTVWFASRVAYSIMYLKNPEKRTIPFVIGVVCMIITTLLALLGIII
jgi:glutathione S-transferase